MPAAGNHENETGNGSPGYLSYQTRFALPPNGSTGFGGLWYAFTAGSVRVISLNNDGVCLRDGGFSTFRRDHIPAPWLAHRETEHPFGFACLDVDPAELGGTTSISVTYYAADAGSRDYAPSDAVVLRKPVRSDARRPRELADARHRA